MGRYLALVIGLGLLAPAVGRAQGIACEKATTPIDKAVCASPQLLEQDKALNAAFAAAVAQNPAGRPALMQGQRSWLTTRRQECGPLEGTARTACLDRSFSARILALQAIALSGGPPPTAAPPTGAPAPATPQPNAPMPTGQAAVPAPASLAGTGPLALPLVVPDSPAVPPTAMAAPAGPAIEGPAASLDHRSWPSAGPTDALLTVTRPGRFSIAAKSATGTALQLVDMLAGPDDWSGEAGVSDGRLDVLLDTGTYKLRALGAEGAIGETTIAVTPFRDAAPPAVLRDGDSLSATLSDHEQRGFWITIDQPRRLRIEAAGRALADLSLWREGRDLVPLPLRRTSIEPTRGHPLSDLLATPMLEAGTYLVAAYGGPARPWADGEAAQPFHLRLGESDAFAAGFLAGRIGPFGSEVLAVPSQADRFRLDLPEPAAAQLAVTTNDSSRQAGIAANSRTPTAWIRGEARGRSPRSVTVTGAEGQPFALRAFGDGANQNLSQGRHLLLAEIVGAGGDEVPPSGLLLRRERDKTPEIVTGFGPEIGAGKAWRARFNMRQVVQVMVRVTSPGPIALRTEGVALRPSLRPVSGDIVAGRADGQATTRWDLTEGWYLLRLEPQEGGSGILDLVMGPPGVTPTAPELALPPDPVMVLGEQSLGKDQSLVLAAPNGRLLSRPLPLDLAARPLVITQRAGEALDLPLASPAGSLRATSLDGATAQAALQGGTLHVPPGPAARNLLLAWQQPVAPPAIPRPAALPRLPVLAADRPLWFDLGRDQSRSIALTLPSGGLYRLETLGRLHTKGEIGTSFLPALDTAEANGTGQNMLIQRYLRAGNYRLTVGALESAGRLGLIAQPAPLVQLAPLGAAGIARVALPAGSGLALPITIAEPGRYRLDLRGLGRRIQGRLEDSEGWPLLPAGDMTQIEQALRPGTYRLVIEPEAVESRLIARLSRVLPPVATEGHGPHPLPIDGEATNQWREPTERGAPREPDRWRFNLAGPATITLTIGDGMGAALHRLDGERIASFAGGAPFEGELAAGRYEVRAQSLGRNDRLDYGLSLGSKELQPEVPREVSLPAEIAFAIAEDRVVSLSTFGSLELRGVLRDAEGRVVAREEGGASDWNLSTSRLLPAGRYTLSLAGPTAISRPRAAGMEGNDSDEEEQPAMDTPSDSEDAPESDDAETTALRLALPATLSEAPLALTGDAVLAEAGVHRLLLPAVPAGQLLVAGARADQALVLSLERRIAGQPWRAVTTARGQVPLVAVPGETGAEWRLSTWTESGDAAPIHLAARLAAPQPQAPDQVTPMAIDSLPGWFVAQVALPAETALAAPSEVLTSSTPGRPLDPAPVLLPQSRRLWLLARSAAPLSLAPLPADRLVLTLPPGETATLPAAPSPRLWLATTGGEPVALEAGHGMGLATGSSLALAGDAPLRLRGPADAPLRVSLRALDPQLGTPGALAPTGFRDSLAPGAAQALTLPAGPKQLRLDLSPGTTAILGWRGADAVTIWTGTAPLSRLAEGDWTEVLLVNTGEAPAPLALAATPTNTPMVLGADRPMRRFFGAAGSVTLPVDARPGQRLMLAGATAASVIGLDGTLREGSGMVLTGPGRLTLDHPAGAVMAWLEGEGATAFPAATPQPTPLPAQMPLSGEAMALAVNPGGPVLLHARTTAPVVLALGDAPPVLFPAGAEFHRYLPGAATLRLLSPQDGPLSGRLELSATPVMPAEEGIGAPIMVAPGGTALFGFTLAREATIGLGLSATPDAVAVRLLDEAGALRGEGIAQLHRRLPAGKYLIEARVPADGVATQLRPALVGLTPRGDGPPADIIRQYQAQAGITPVTAPR